MAGRGGRMWRWVGVAQEPFGVGKGFLGLFCTFPYCSLMVPGRRMWMPEESMMSLMVVSCKVIK